MADKLISQIPTTAAYSTPDDWVETEQGGVSKKIPAAQLIKKLKSRVVTGSTSFTSTDYEIIVNAASATISLPLLDASNPGREICVRKVNAGSGTVTINRAGTDVITSGSLTAVTLTSDGDFWVLKDVGSRWELINGKEVITGSTTIEKEYTGTVKATYVSNSLSITTSNASGTLFVSDPIASIGYGLTMVSIRYSSIDISGDANSLAAWVCTDSSTAETLSAWASFRVIDTLNSTQTVDVKAIAIGEWY